jgi:hypothetical protein
MSYAVIKEYYEKGLFNDTNLDLFVKCGWITQKEANEIKGD